MCTGFEYALIAATTASTGAQLHAANTAPKPKAAQQANKQPVVRTKKRPSRGTTGGADAGFNMLNVGAPTLLGG